MHHDTEVTGCIGVEPALNDAERDFLTDLRDSGRTLRGTPTGRGDGGVPFARLAWEPCADGCCLEWNRDLEDAKWMAESGELVTVTDNQVTGSTVPVRCDSPPAPRLAQPVTSSRPDNVIDLRPRRA